MEKNHYSLDKIKLNNWLNIRKINLDQLNIDLKKN